MRFSENMTFFLKFFCCCVLLIWLQSGGIGRGREAMDGDSVVGAEGVLVSQFSGAILKIMNELQFFVEFVFCDLVVTIVSNLA